MKNENIIALVGVLISLATMLILYMQFKEQKKLWELQRENTKVDLQNKKANL